MAGDAAKFYPSEVRIQQLALIRCERRLPLPGEVLTRPGERVEPTEIVARTRQTEDFRILDVARRLRVPRGQIGDLLTKKVGDTVEANEVIAARKGILRRTVRAPAPGKIVAIGNGRVLLEVTPTPIEVQAFLKGIVMSARSGSSVTVEAAGAIVEATWGHGGETFGVMRVVADKPEEPLRAKDIDVACHGAIVVGGAWIEESALDQAQQLQVRALIAGSMDGALRARAEAAPFLVILTEGFGRVPMAGPVFQLLRAQSGREASISADTRVRYGATRPLVLVPLPTESRPSPLPPPGAPLAVGASVRIVRPPFLGAVGTVSAIPDKAQRIETGARLPGAEVVLGGSIGVVFVPYVNLEILR